MTGSQQKVQVFAWQTWLVPRRVQLATGEIILIRTMWGRNPTGFKGTKQFCYVLAPHGLRLKHVTPSLWEIWAGEQRLFVIDLIHSPPLLTGPPSGEK